MLRTTLTCVSLAALPAACDRAAASQTASAVTIAAEHDVAAAATALRVRLVQLTYAPGDSSPPHSHTCPVVAHVLEGALRSRLEGGPEVIYRAGQGFAEPANTQHLVSANASHTEPVRFLALFLCDANAQPEEDRQR